LMTHTSGLPPDLELRTDWSGYETAIQKACAETLQSKPGTVFKYSDINFILLGEIVQRVSKVPLPVFVSRSGGRPEVCVSNSLTVTRSLSSPVNSGM